MTSKVVLLDEQQERTSHDSLVWHVAASLTCKGYIVRANHPKWAGDRPYEINGQKPDIIALKKGEEFFFEIETCHSFNSETTKEKLQALMGKGHVFVIVPSHFDNSDSKNDPDFVLRKRLEEWQLTEVRVGTCNPDTGMVAGFRIL